MPQNSITQFLAALKTGDDQAAMDIWNRYAERLVRFARNRLRNSTRRVTDEEDAALCAFDSFCRAAKAGRFAKLENRDDLWQLLILITVRKAADLSKHERRLKRGGGVVVSELVDDLVAVEPTPELAVSATEQYNKLLNLLDDEELVQVATAKMEGHTQAEIAERLGCTRQTIHRRLQLIRSIWEDELG